MMEKTTLAQITNIKYKAIALITYQANRLTLTEKSAVLRLYELMDEILLDKIYSERYTVEEYVDSLLIEHSMIFRGSKNTEVKKLGKLIEGGLKW